MEAGVARGFALEPVEENPAAPRNPLKEARPASVGLFLSKGSGPRSDLSTAC